MYLALKRRDERLCMRASINGGVDGRILMSGFPVVSSQPSLLSTKAGHTLALIAPNM